MDSRKKRTLFIVCCAIFIITYLVALVGYSVYLDKAVRPKGLDDTGLVVKTINGVSVNIFAKKYDYGDIVDDCKIVYTDGKKKKQDILILKPLKGDTTKYSYYVAGNKGNGYGTVYKVVQTTASGNTDKEK